MGIWEGPVLFVGLMIGIMILFAIGKWIFVDMFNVKESKYVSVFFILFFVGFVALLTTADRKSSDIQAEPGIDYWIRP